MPFAALNTPQNKSNSKNDESYKCVTKEALEAEAVASFQKSLKLQKDGLFTEAKETYLELLEGPFLANENGCKPKNGVARASVHLKYCVLKNLGITCEKLSRLSEALDNYLKAATIDDSDITLWLTIGKLAELSLNVSLAKFCYKIIRERNSEFVPSLEREICILYAIESYDECIDIISNSLKKNRNFLGGLIILKQIYKYVPSLKDEAKIILRNCKSDLLFAEIPEDESLQILKDIKQMRDKFKNLHSLAAQDLPNVNFYILSARWMDIGTFILQVCNSVSDFDLGCSVLAYEVDLESCLKIETTVAMCVSQQPEVPMESNHQNDLEIPTSNEVLACEEMQVDEVICKAEEHQRLDTAESSREDKEQENFVMPDNLLGQVEKRKGKKRKLSMMFFDEPEYKRRSSRVKNPARSKAVEMSESFGTIRGLLPDCFHKSEFQEDDEGTKVSEEKKITSEPAIQCSDPKLNLMNFGEEEEEAVIEFVKHHPGRYSMVEIIKNYLLVLQQSSHLQWSSNLKDIYTKCFEVLRNNSEMEFITSSHSYEDLTKLCLVFLELKLEGSMKKVTNDKNVHLMKNKETKNTSTSNQFTALKDRDGGETISEFEFQVELNYLEKGIKDLDDKMKVRAFWLVARIYRELGILDDSLYYFNEALELLKSSGIGSVDIPNCKSSGTISQEHINEVMNHVEKSCSIEGISKIFEKGEYRQVIELLSDAPLHTEDLESDEKKQQMFWLLESYAALKEYENCFVWLERIFCCALKIICKSKDKSGMFIDVIKKCLSYMEICTEHLGSNLKHVKSCARFINNLASLLELIFEDPDFKHSKDFENHAVFMWILLYKMIRWHESDDKVEDDDIPHHMQVLMNGHDHLGRKCWCSLNNGEFLLFLVNELKVEMDLPENEPSYSDITSALEQAFHCLYGHPSKKSRGRYLEDHSSKQIPLDWTGGQLLYKLFRPESLPEYDSYKTSAISSECANLLLKLKKLCPKIDDFDQLVNNVESYLSGASDQIPVQLTHLDSLAEEIFYLLADFYFKNGETKKAMKYYIRDLSLCPNRLDSWAALALIHSSFLTDILSEHDVKPDVNISPHLKPGLRSFERALSIDKSSSKLWIEYGSFAYVLHTHFSYLSKKGLKRESDRDEMLELSGRCFESARVNDTGSGEEWLEHYMLGKVAEKSCQRPEVFLEYYLKASEYLHLEKAKYPRRSFSYYNPPHLAVESLEMFYRMHASTMKYLIKHETQLEKISFEVFEKYLKLSAESPLVRGTELQERKKLDASEEKDKTRSSEAVLVDENEEEEPEITLNISENAESDFSYGADRKVSMSYDKSTGPEIHADESDMKKDELSGPGETMITEDGLTNCQSLSTNGNLEDQNSFAEAQEDVQMEVIEETDFHPLTSKIEVQAHLDVTPRIISDDERFSNLISTCIKAFSFILSRYPWHFKSTYRLAYLFFHCRKLRNLEACRALLVGHSYVPISSISKCNGLFCERKPSNFFNGLWRLPSTELDRCGSFSSHLSRSVHLLCDLCRALQDPRMLFFLHQQLARCPENVTKKYLRDYDREALSKHAFEDCCVVLKHQVENVLRASEPKVSTSVQDLLLRVYNIRQQCFKMSTRLLDSMMTQLFCSIFPNLVDPALDDIKRFCTAQQHARTFSMPMIQGAHQAIQNASDPKRCAGNITQNWPQRMPQINQTSGNSLQRLESGHERTSNSEMNKSGEDGKLKVSGSDDVEIIDGPESCGPITNLPHQTKPAPHSLGPQTQNPNMSAQSPVKNIPMHPQVLRQAPQFSVKNLNPAQNNLWRNSHKEQNLPGLPVQLRLGPGVFPDASRHRPPAPRQQTECAPRANQRPSFNHMLAENEVIVLSEDSD